MFEIFVDEYKAPYNAIPIGHQGENEARCLIWNLAPYIQEFGDDGVCQVKVTQPETKYVYFATNVAKVGNLAIWTVTNVDTAKHGTGMCELYYNAPDGTTLAKSDVYKTWIFPTQGDAGDAPSPYDDIIERVGDLAAEAEASANSASSYAEAAAQSATEAGAAAQSAVEESVAELQAELDQAISGATVDSEVINARVDADGTTYSTLKQRLDAENTELKNHLIKINSTITGKDLIFVIGGMSENGIEYSFGSQNRINSTKSMVYTLGGTIECNSSYKFRVGYYASPELPINQIPPGFVKWSDWITNDSYTVESGFYVVILAGRSDNAVISHASDVSDNLHISLDVSTQYTEYRKTTSVIDNSKLWSQGLYSAGSGNYEANAYRIKLNGYIPEYVDAIFTDSPYLFRVCAWDSDNSFIGVYKTTGTFELGTENLKNLNKIRMDEIRSTFPGYRFKLYAFSVAENGSTTGVAISPTEAEHIYFLENLITKSLDNITKFNGKVVAILGDSISTNGNSGIDSNVPEITVQPEDVGVELSAYLTYYDVQAGLSLGGHTFTSSEIGTEVTFTPTASDVGKSIGLPNNYNDNVVTTWWEIMQEELGVQCIPNTWSGASITSHEANIDTRKCSYAWHESQIRKCGVRIAGAMQRVAPDIIIIYRGTNDMTHLPYTLLTDDYFDNINWEYPSTDAIQGGYGFKQGMCLTIKKLRDAYPNAKIFLCTLNVFKRINYSHFPTNNGINTLPQYNNAIREIADFMGCGVIEFDKDGITFENCYSQGYITDSSSIPTHPNDKGHRVMGLKAIADLQSQYSDMD